MMTVRDLLQHLDGVPHDALVLIRTRGDNGRPVVTWIGGASVEYSGFCDPETKVYLSNTGSGPTVNGERT